MTDLDIPDTIDDHTRRDQWGRYLVVPPDGRKPVGYTRATTVAKTLDGEGGLQLWKATMAITGAMRRPGLRAKWEALVAKHPQSGPWYASDSVKKECKKLVEECAEAGGSTDRRDIGDALHSIVCQVNRGQEPLLVQDTTTADLDAYRAAIDTAGVEIDPRYCETMVVLDDWGVAGTADMLRVTIDGTDYVADLKTGDIKVDEKWAWPPFAIQLAIYARGDNIYRQGAAADGSEDERSAMPNVSQERAVIIHLPAGRATCNLYWVDIAAGWEAFEHSIWTRRWRARNDLREPYTPRHPKRTPKPPALDEGDEIPAAKIDALQRAYASLSAEASAWATAVMIQGNAGRQPWNRLTAHPTRRRYELYRGVGTLAKHTADVGALDEWVRLIVATVTGNDSAQFPTNLPGLLLGELDADAARRFAEICADVAAGRHLLGTDDSGVPKLIVAGRA